MTFLKLILSFLGGGGGIAAIGKEIRQARKDGLEAKNDADRIEAENVQAQLEARRSVLIAEIDADRTWWVRPALIIPFVIYIWKLVIWDKILKLGVTEDLSPDLWKLFWIMIGFYFLTRGGEKIVSRLRRK